MRRAKNLCAVAFLASMAAMSANATEFITTDGATVSGEYKDQTGEFGGAIYNKAKDVKVENATFTGNKATSTEKNKGDAGALRNGSSDEETSLQYIKNSKFIKNTAPSSGGAITNGTDDVIKDGIINCIFENNQAQAKDEYHGDGGAIWNDGNILGQGVYKSTFKGNSAERSGGAIAHWGEKLSQIEGSTFIENKSKEGGAVATYKNIVKINNSTFKNNTASSVGGAVALLRGYKEGKEAETFSGEIDTISNSTFEGNNATSKEDTTYGGAIYNKPDGVIGTIKNSTFKNNYTSDSPSDSEYTSGGGAIYNGATLKNLVNSTFSGNHSERGGAIYNNGTFNKISNVTFNGNYATHSGGAIYNNNTINAIQGSTFIGNHAGDFGGAIGNNGTISSIKNSVFDGNYADASESKKQAGGGAIDTEKALVIENSTFTNNYVKTADELAYGSAINTGGNLDIIDTDFINNKIYTTSTENDKSGAISMTSPSNDISLNIYAKSKDVKFTGNEYIILDEKGKSQSTTPVDLEIYNATINLNSLKNKSITFDGQIIATENTPVNINKEKGYGGEIIFNNIVTADILNIEGGKLSIGASKDGASNLQATKLNVNAGTLNLSNDYIEEVQLSELSFEDSGDIIIDADLKTNSIDHFAPNEDYYPSISQTGTINIKEVNVMSEATEDTTSAPIIKKPFKVDAPNTKLPTVFTSDNKYDVTSAYNISSDTANLIFTKTAGGGGLNNLVSYAPEDADSYLSYTLTKDEKLTQDLKPFNSNVSSIVINGKKDFSITGNKTKGFEISSGQDFLMKDVKTISNFKSANGGVIYNNGGNSELQRIAFENNSSTGNGGAITTTGGDLIVTDSSFKNNTATGKGGAIYAGSGSNVEINAKTTDVVFENNKAGKETNAIYMDGASGKAGGTLYLNANGDRKISLAGINGTTKGYTIKINENLKNGGTVEVTDKVQNATADGGIHLYGGTLKVANDTYLDKNALSLHGCALDMANNVVGLMNLSSLSLENTTNLHLDVDLDKASMDRIKATNISGDGYLNIDKLNVLTDTGKQEVKITFAGKDYGNEKLTSHIKNSVTSVSGPLYKYDVSAKKSGNDYQFTFGHDGGGGVTEFSSNAYIGQVAAQMGGFANQLNLYEQAFGSMETLTSMTAKQLKAYKDANKYASSEEPLYADNRHIGSETGIWFKPSTSFERVKMKNNPYKVKNFMYDALVGADTGLQEHRKGWSSLCNVYAGYIGSHQSFDGVSMYQNGGTVGATGMLFKNNFFGGLTVNVGGSGVESSGKYGKDDFGMLSTGVATKMGYNWGLANDKFIIQPNFVASYSFIKTSNHVDGTGSKVRSKGLNALQIAPGLKLIGNFKNSWQPYLGASYMWNILDKAKYTVADVSIPQASIKPYIEYYVGLQKGVGERFTGYAQFMGRNIGRNGFAFSLGGRWELGK